MYAWTQTKFWEIPPFLVGQAMPLFRPDNVTRLSGIRYTGFRSGLQDREPDGPKQNPPNTEQFDPYIDRYQHI